MITDTRTTRKRNAFGG